MTPTQTNIQSVHDDLEVHEKRLMEYRDALRGTVTGQTFNHILDMVQRARMNLETDLPTDLCAKPTPKKV